MQLYHMIIFVLKNKNYLTGLEKYIPLRFIIFLKIKPLGKYLFLSTHSTTMLVSFQMEHSVDKQKTEEFRIGFSEELRVLLGAAQTDHNLAGAFRERKAQYVRRFVFRAIFLIQFLREFRCGKHDAQFIFFPEDFFLKTDKRQAWELAFCQSFDRYIFMMIVRH